MKNPYQNLLETIPVPEGLERRVLSAAGKQAAARERIFPRRRGRRMLQAAVCGVCALTLVLGTLTFWEPESSAGGSPVQNDQDAAPRLSPSFSFGLTAYAAETGETYAPNANRGLALSSSGGMTWSDGNGYFSGCLFQVTGENIQSLDLSLNQGQLYSWEQTGGLSAAEMEAMQAAQAADSSLPPVLGIRQEDGLWSVQRQILLGSQTSTDYDPDVRYGFWTDGLDLNAWQENPRTAAQASVDQLDGAKLTVTVHFTDGSQDTQIYTLSTGLLKMETAADGTFTLLPQLSGEDTPAMYGVYVVDQARSRFLRWPLEGSTKISMSYPFGSWKRTLVNENEAGETEIIETTIVHNGIDIPALRGSAITAAEAGTVAETGFDPERGNYVVLDHGGLRTVYAACAEISVSEGDTVAAGQEIALVGSTGKSTGPHLCFQVWQNGQAQNPVAYFDSAVRATLSVG